MPVFNIGSSEPFRTPVLNGNYPENVMIPFVAGESKSASFQVQVTDPGMPAAHTFQWYVDGSAVSGATSSTYTIAGLNAAVTKTVYCKVTNTAGTVQSRTATLTVVEYKTPVLKADYPRDRTMSVVDDATSTTFAVAVETAGVPASYTWQWYVNEAAVEGATQSSFEMDEIAAGTYTVYCKVTNAAGTVKSRVATLKVVQYRRPVLNSALPANVTVLESAAASAAFRVSITTPGVPASYSYQWYVNNEAVSGATSATFTKTGLTQAGTYTVCCKVTNAAGTVQSRTATLTVSSAFPAYTYTGTSQLVKDGYSWNLLLKTSGTLTFSSLGNGADGIDVFCVGGGGGATKFCGGAGGGYTTTAKNVTAETGTPHAIVVGAGGTAASGHANGGRGGTTTALGVKAEGGYGGIWAELREGEESKVYAYRVGADGGSGGGGYGGAGGTNGADGEAGVSNYGGKGQGITTRAFGENGGTLYAAGGCGLGGENVAPAANTGDGADAGGNAGSFNGGSGVVIIRNKR